MGLGGSYLTSHLLDTKFVCSRHEVCTWFWVFFFGGTESVVKHDLLTGSTDCLPVSNSDGVTVKWSPVSPIQGNVRKLVSHNCNSPSTWNQTWEMKCVFQTWLEALDGLHALNLEFPPSQCNLLFQEWNLLILSWHCCLLWIDIVVCYESLKRELKTKPILLFIKNR